jgi:hypothetical protein
LETLLITVLDRDDAYRSQVRIDNVPALHNRG